MKLSGIIWFEEIVEKIERKHHVTQEEVSKFSEVRHILDLWRRDTAVGKMFIRHWARLERAAI